MFGGQASKARLLPEWSNPHRSPANSAQKRQSDSGLGLGYFLCKRPHSKPETRHPKPESRRQNPESRILNPESRNQECVPGVPNDGSFPRDGAHGHRALLLMLATAPNVTNCLMLTTTSNVADGSSHTGQVRVPGVRDDGAVLRDGAHGHRPLLLMLTTALHVANWPNVDSNVQCC